MSDEEGKTRRNLIVLSSAVVTIAFLKIPIQGTLVGIDLSKVDSTRAWQAALFALVYFSVRYFLDKGNRKGLNVWTSQALEHQPRHVKAYLQTSRANENWQDWRLETPNPDPSGNSRLMLYRLNNEPQWSYLPGRRYANAKAYWQPPAEREDEQHFAKPLKIFAVTQKIPGAIYWGSWITALFRTFRLSWEFTEFVLPYVWAAIAVGVCLAALL